MPTLPPSLTSLTLPGPSESPPMRFTTLRNSTGEPLSLSSTSKAGERDTIIVPQESSLTSYLADSESSEPQKIPPWPRDLASSSPSVSPGSLNGDLGRNSSSSTRLHDERQFRLTSKTSDHNLQPRANSLPSPASSRVREFLNRPTPSSAPVDSFVAHTTPPTVVASAFDEAEARGIHDPTGNDIENLTPPPARPSAPTPGKEATPALRRRASLALAQALRDLEREMGLLQSDDDAVLTPYITQAHTSTHPSGGSGSGAEPYARRANASPVPRSERRVPGYVPGMHRPIPQRQSQQQQSASSDHAGFVGLIGTSNAQAPASPNVPPIVQSAGATSFGPIPAMPAPPLGPTSPQQDTRQIYIPPLSGTSAPRSTRKAARRTTDANALFQTSSYSTSPQTYRTRAPSRGPIARLPTSGNQQDTSGPPQRPNATLSPAAPAVQLRPTTRGTAITIRKPNGDIFFYTPASKLRPVSIDMPPSDSRLASLAPPPVSTTSYLGTTPETGEPPKMLAVGLESAKDRDGRLKAEDKQLQERTEKVVAAAQFKAKEDREARIAPPPSRLGELFRPPLSWRLAREAEEEQAAADAAPTAKAEEGADAAQTIPEQQIDNAIPIPGNYSKPESRAATALVGKESLITQVTTALPTSNGNMNRSSLSQPHSDGTMNTLAINGMASGHAKLKVSFPTYTGTEKAPPSKLILNVPKASPEHLKPSPAGSAAVGPPSLVRTPASTPKPTNTTTTYTSGVAVTTVNERPSLTAEDQKDGESIAAPALNLTEPVQYKTYYPPLLQRQPLQTVHDLTGENHTLRLLGLDGCSPYSLRGTEAAEAGTKLHSFLRTCSSDPTIYTNTLKVLQDLCAASEELPSCYKLQSVVFDRRDVIGKGGEASIYSGNFNGQRVVLREVVMPRNYWRSPTGRNAIKLINREVITHSQLEHPNIIPLLGVFCESSDTPPLMVLPLVERGSLADMIANEVIQGVQFARIIVGAGRALAYLHSRKPPIFHGDLHPGNILIDATGNALVCDFGYSRICHEVTRTHTAMREGGRTRFMAPELLAGEDEKFRTSSASDIFSLSMTFLNIWTRKSPFDELPNDRKVEAAIQRRQRPDRPTIQIGLPPTKEQEFWVLLVDMWAHEPFCRVSTEEVQNRLETIFCHLLGQHNVEVTYSAD